MPLTGFTFDASFEFLCDVFCGNAAVCVRPALVHVDLSFEAILARGERVVSESRVITRSVQ